MRYLSVSTLVLVGLMALPQSVAAQSGEEAEALAVHAKYHRPRQLMLRASYYLYLEANANTGATSDQTEPNAAEPASEPTPEEPALELKLDDAGVQVTPPPQSQQTKQRSRGAKAGIALGVTLGVGIIGVGIGVAVAAARFDRRFEW